MCSLLKIQYLFVHFFLHKLLFSLSQLISTIEIFYECTLVVLKVPTLLIGRPEHISGCFRFHYVGLIRGICCFALTHCLVLHDVRRVVLIVSSLRLGLGNF